MDEQDKKKIVCSTAPSKALQIPELRKKSRMDYLRKRREDRLVELEVDIKDNKYVFDDVQ